MTANHLIGHYFFDGPVNAKSYAEMLEVWLIPQFRDRGLMGDVWLQHDGAPAHFALTVRHILNEHFPGRWIGCGSPTSPATLSWPPHSPDELRRAMEQVFTTIMPEVLWRMSHRTWWCIRLCFEHDGTHKDPLDIQ
jgi:hypothetical protein